MSSRSCSNSVFLSLARGWVILAVSGLLLAEPVAAGFYSWTDESGRTHYTDDPSNIPEEYRLKDNLKKHADAPGAPRKPASPPRATGSPVHEVELIQAASGNFLVDVVINSKVKARLMVDTGASIVILSKEIGDRLGFTRDRSTPELPTMTAGGMVWTPMTVINSLRVGEAEAVFVEAGFNDEMKGIDGLLGMSFLGDFRVEMDQQDGKMKLRPLMKKGEPLWDGKPGRWWKNRLRSYTERVDEIETGAGLMELTNHPDATRIRNLVEYYQGLKSNLLKRARRERVPSRYLH